MKLIVLTALLVLFSSFCYAAQPDLPTLVYGRINFGDGVPAGNVPVEAVWTDSDGIEHSMTTRTSDELEREGYFFFNQGYVQARPGSLIKVVSGDVSVEIPSNPGKSPVEVEAIALSMNSPSKPVPVGSTEEQEEEQVKEDEIRIKGRGSRRILLANETEGIVDKEPSLLEMVKSLFDDGPQPPLPPGYEDEYSDSLNESGDKWFDRFIDGVGIKTSSDSPALGIKEKISSSKEKTTAVIPTLAPSQNNAEYKKVPESETVSQSESVEIMTDAQKDYLFYIGIAVLLAFLAYVIFAFRKDAYYRLQNMKVSLAVSPIVKATKRLGLVKAGDIMSVNTVIYAGDGLETVADACVSSDTGCVVIGQKKPKVANADDIANVILTSENLSFVKASQIRSFSSSVEHNASLSKVVRLMAQSKICIVPVKKGGSTIGVVTVGDVGQRLAKFFSQYAFDSGVPNLGSICETNLMFAIKDEVFRKVAKAGVVAVMKKKSMKHNDLMGILTPISVAEAFYTYGKKSLNMKLPEIIDRKPHVMHAKMSVISANRLMLEHRANYILVVKDEKLIGFVKHGQVISALHTFVQGIRSGSTAVTR